MNVKWIMPIFPAGLVVFPVMTGATSQVRSRFTCDTDFRGALTAVMIRGQLGRVGLSSFEFQVFRAE